MLVIASQALGWIILDVVFNLMSLVKDFVIYVCCTGKNALCCTNCMYGKFGFSVADAFVSVFFKQLQINLAFPAIPLLPAIGVISFTIE